MINDHTEHFVSLENYYYTSMLFFYAFDYTGLDLSLVGFGLGRSRNTWLISVSLLCSHLAIIPYRLYVSLYICSMTIRQVWRPVKYKSHTKH